MYLNFKEKIVLIKQSSILMLYLGQDLFFSVWEDAHLSYKIYGILFATRDQGICIAIWRKYEWLIFQYYKGKTNTPTNV